MLSSQNPLTTPSSQPAIFSPSSSPGFSAGLGSLSSVQAAPLSPRRSLSRSSSTTSLSPSTMDQVTAPASLQLPQSPRLSPRLSSPKLSPRASPSISPMGSPTVSTRLSPRLSPSLLEARLSIGTTNDVDEALVDTYLSEMGNEQQLLTFFQRYANHQGLSDKCALDGRYFWKILSAYIGLVDSDLFLRINQGPPEIACGGKVHRPYEALDIAFDLNDLARTKDAPVRYRLIKFILDIGNDPSENTGGVHTNLIYIDTKKKEIVRFEPMHDEYYTEKVNDILKKYFAKILPDYEFKMLKEHPQLPTTESCPSKGMCAAYVLKKAMMLVTDNDRPLNRDPKEEELKIMQFADAIETEYGILPSDNEPEHGLTLAFTPAPYATPYGPTVMYGPSIIPYPYPPEYYGFVHGPRFARRPGYGFGRHRHRHWGNLQNREPALMADVKQRLETGYNTAKQRNKEYGRYSHGKHSTQKKSDYHGGKPLAPANRGQYGSVEYGSVEYGGDVHHHYHGCGCEGCNAAAPRAQSGYWAPPMTQSYSRPISPYASPNRILATATSAPPSTLSTEWNPVPPSRITIARSPVGAAVLQRETITESQFLDPETGTIVKQTQVTSTPLNTPISPIGGEFGCGCGAPAKNKTTLKVRGEYGTGNSNLSGPLGSAALDNEYGRTNSNRRSSLNGRREETGRWEAPVVKSTPGDVYSTYESERQARELERDKSWGNSNYNHYNDTFTDENPRHQYGLTRGQGTTAGVVAGAATGFLVGGPVTAAIGGIVGGALAHSAQRREPILL